MRKYKFGIQLLMISAYLLIAVSSCDNLPKEEESNSISNPYLTINSDTSTINESSCYDDGIKEYDERKGPPPDINTSPQGKECIGFAQRMAYLVIYDGEHFIGQTYDDALDKGPLTDIDTRYFVWRNGHIKKPGYVLTWEIDGEIQHAVTFLKTDTETDVPYVVHTNGPGDMDAPNPDNPDNYEEVDALLRDIHRNFVIVYKTYIPKCLTFINQVIPIDAVSIIGPSYVYIPAKGEPSVTVTWTSSVSGGTPPYTYKWYRSTGGSDFYLVGTGSSYSRSYSFIGYNQRISTELKLEVTDSNGMTKSATKPVTEISTDDSFPY